MQKKQKLSVVAGVAVVSLAFYIILRPDPLSLEDVVTPTGVALEEPSAIDPHVTAALQLEGYDTTSSPFEELTDNDVQHLREDDNEAKRFMNLSVDASNLTSRQQLTSGRQMETYTNAEGQTLTRIYEHEKVVEEKIELAGGEAFTVRFYNGESEDDGHVTSVTAHKGSLSWTNHYDNVGIVSKEENKNGIVTCVHYEGETPARRRAGACVLESDRPTAILQNLL